MPALFRRWRSAVVATPLGWALLGFGAAFHYATFIRTVGWNAIELIIAQHLLSHGAYVTGLDYPSALVWRPVLPTLMVAGLRLITSDPLLIYQCFCGIAIAASASCLFWAARRLGGLGAAHGAAGLTLACPAILGLIDHIHSYSHLGGLLWLSAALAGGLPLLLASREAPPAPKAAVLSGALWGLAFLCRSELLLFAAAQGAAMLWLQFRHRRPFRLVAAYGLAFLVFYAPYNLYGSYVARRDGSLIRKSIYGFYISQGWADPEPGSGGDVEADGYAYAIRLYGDPLANGESAVTAIRRHPAVFARRVGLNARAFYRHFADPDFYPWTWSLAAALALGAALAGFVPARERVAAIFLGALIAACHFVLAFHIDSRYLTIAAPPLVLLASYGGVLLWRAAARGPAAARVAAAAALVGIPAWSAWAQVGRWDGHRPARDPGLAAMRALGGYFRAAAGKDRDIVNREPHIGFVFPAGRPLPPEDEFLLAYFARTSWVNHGANDAFPRGKFYAYRECPNDYVYLPAAQFTGPASDGRTVIGTCEAPGLGRYVLLKEP